LSFSIIGMEISFGNPVFYRCVLVMMFVCTITSTTVAQKKKKEVASAVPSVKLREAEFYFTEGEKHFILEDYAKALIYYQKSLDVHADNATVHYKIAEVLSRSNKRDDLTRASISIEQALSMERKNKYFYLLAAQIYTNLSRFDQAAATYETLFTEVPNTQEYLYELAAVYQYANKKEDALKAYTRAETYFGVNEMASLQKVKLLFELTRNEEAMREASAIVAALPDEETIIVAVAELLSQNQAKPQAITILENFTRENAQAASASLLLAGLYRDTNREAEARTLLLASFNDTELEFTSKLIVLGTYNAELNQNRAKNVVDADKEKFVLALFELLEKQHAGEEAVHVLGGDLYLTLDKKEEAQKQYLAAIHAGSTTFEVWQNLLYLELQLERFDDVIIHSEKALEYHPNQAMVYYFNGLAQLRKRKNQDAAVSLEQAKKLAASNAAMVSDINGMLGDAYNALKQYEKSDKAYDDALAFNTQNEVILNNYSYYLALRKVNLDKAERMSAQLIKNNPENATYLDTYAWVLYVREKYKDARKVMEKAIGTGMASATHFEHYGDILFKLGDVENAVKQWEKAKNMLTTSSEVLNKKIANRKIYE
jgi:tetratricopeptide (TPR) repeat protein